MLYDADCGFCKWLLSGLLRWDRAERLNPIALQRPEADELLGELTPAERMASWHLISPTGERRSGGAALPPLIRLLPRRTAARQPPLGCSPRSANAAIDGWPHTAQCSRGWVPAGSKRRAGERVRRRETR